MSKPASSLKKTLVLKFGFGSNKWGVFRCVSHQRATQKIASIYVVWIPEIMKNFFGVKRQTDLIGRSFFLDRLKTKYQKDIGTLKNH
jgi:hypothetical protein